MSHPTWIDHEPAAGNVTGANRTARVSKCRDCGAAVVTGLCLDVGGYAATCDPTPLDAVGEALALLTGRATFRLARNPARLELTLRGRPDITAQPPGGAYDVVADHRCGQMLPALTSAITPAAGDGWGLPTDPPF